VAIVLVVDDEIGVATLLEDVLQDEGYRVLTASNGRQALERIAAERPDLILSDFMMPVMDGAALISALAASPDLTSIPVMLMSSLPEAAIAERCNGYAAFLRKSFNFIDVVEMVARLVSDTSPPADQSAPTPPYSCGNGQPDNTSRCQTARATH
jgi:CheY-like chemotaxis protein